MSDKAVCTIVTKSHIAYARALCRGLARHDPGVPLYVLLADEPEGFVDPGGEPFTVLTFADLAERETAENMAFYYTPFELCCALRPHLHQYMLEKTDHSRWCFLDADIFIADSLEPVFEELRHASIFLNPHCTRETGNANPLESTLAKLGVYNGGFLGLRRDATAEAFIEWFKRRLEFHCLSVERGFFVDQLWLNLVPHFFEDVTFLSHPGANLAHWNLHERELVKTADGRFLVNGEPLLFIHFSGADLDAPENVSRYAPDLDGKASPAWGELLRRYAASLREEGLEETASFPYSYACYADGREIYPEDRQKFWEDCKAGVPRKESPFGRLDWHPKTSVRRALTRYVRDQIHIVGDQVRLLKKLTHVLFTTSRPLPPVRARQDETSPTAEEKCDSKAA